MDNQMPAQNLVNVIDPDTQQVGSIPQAQLSEAVSQGYLQASPEDVQKFVSEQKYGTTTEKIKAGLEHAASSATFGLSTGIEKASGVKAKDIRGRSEENPISAGIGDVAGLLGSSLAGVGEGALLDTVGSGAAKLTGLGGEGAGFLSKIGSSAVKNAVEFPLFQAGDENSKMLSQDPNQTVQSALTNIGLSSLIGAGSAPAFGVVSPLWKATSGSKVGQILKAITDRAGGIDGAIPDAMKEAIETSGLNPAPEIRAGLSDNPVFQQMFKTLEQSDTTKSGPELQETYKTFRKQASDSLVTALGKSPEDVGSMGELSKYEAGKEIGQKLSEELKSQIDPLTEKFEKIKAQYAGKELPQGLTDKISENLAQLIQSEGWYASPSSDIMSEANRVLKELPQLKNLKDLNHYMTAIGNNTYDFANPQLTRAGSLMKNILREAEADVVQQTLAEKAPELISEHMQARASWKNLSDLTESLNDRLHVGGSTSPGSFVKNLSAMASESGERVLQRLSGKNDAALLQLISEKFPQTADLIKNYHVNDLLKTAATKAVPGEAINGGALVRAMEKMSPELRDFAITPDAAKKIQSVGSMLDQLHSLPHNFSNTARTLDKLSQYLPGSAMAILTMVISHNPVASLLVGPLMKYLGKDVPDAVRLALLKFIGSNKPIESEAFKNMVEMISHASKGENLIHRASKAVFKAGAEVLSQTAMPDEKDRKKLDSQLQKLQTDPSSLFKVGGSTAHYLPDHGTALAQTSVGAVNYLNSVRPGTSQASPLDKKIEPSTTKIAAYHRALDIGEQPLVVLQHIKNGTLQTQDVAALKTMYPALYEKMSEKLTEHLVDHVGGENSIPYPTRMSLSLFLGQPLDSTMTPEAIRATQPQNHPASPSEIQNQHQKHSMMALNKLSAGYETPGQSREAARMK